MRARNEAKAKSSLLGRLVLALLIVGLAAAPAASRKDMPAGHHPPPNVSGGLVLDGSFVHNVGELQMNITNMGVFGSYPSWNWAMSESPSAQWPAGSGVEYLWAAGLWCGARVSGIPRVTTSNAYEWEFRPGLDPVFTLYRSFEGTRNGNRLPSPSADDDVDGRVDEDPLDGLDNDGDGAIDEDFAAISNQMFRCSYRDNLPESFSSSPDHQPLNILVVQESYQWENDRVDDFVGVEFHIYNMGEQTLEDFYMAFFADPDVGARTLPNNYEDDLVDVVDRVACVKKGSFQLPVHFAMGVAWDKDGDIGNQYNSPPAPGQIGIMFMGHTTDPAGVKAPPRITLRSWQAFSGNATFEDGGDPSTDNQSYQLMSAESSDKPPTIERDFRMLLSAGPFLLEAGDSLQFQVAFVVGPGREGLLDNAAQAKLTFDGNFFNLDDDGSTGIDCKETRLYDPFNDIEWASPCPADSNLAPVIVGKGEVLWVNNDCDVEVEANELCPNPEQWCTGVDGKESQIHWLFGSPPPPPNLRVWPTEGKNVLFWDNFSEAVPDVSELIYDFEGYRVWRADNWDRPYGSSVENGPSSDLWMLLDEFDLANGLGTDTGLESLRYQPNVDANLMAFYSEALMADPSIESSMDLIPPSGFTLAEADTAIALSRYELGLPGGKVYYRYEDTQIHTGMNYFYAVTAMDHVPVFENGMIVGYAIGLSGDPSSGFVYTVPQSKSQAAWDFDPDRVYVVPNPATTASLAPWALNPNNDDPTGLKVEFRHLPAALCTIRIYSLAGDLVETIIHDASGAVSSGDYASTGTATWDLVSRNGQDVASGVYIFSVEADNFDSVVGKFVVIR